MDGNGRWAAERNLPREAGHREGLKAAQRIVEQAVRSGVSHITLYSFSTENWSRPEYEVRSLMGLFNEFIRTELESPRLSKNGVRFRPIGDLSRFSPELNALIAKLVEVTANGDKLEMNLALNYGGREDIVNAAKQAALSAIKGELPVESFTEQYIASLLRTEGTPDPDLLIRTGGEKRISNFLLWQLSYTELVFRDEFWPDFSEQHFIACLEEFSRRQRRFGATEPNYNQNLNA
jgi:undecaprenyl diphosphate synthase